MTTPAVAERAACPACGAATRLGDPWCTLCYADLSPATAEPGDAEAHVGPSIPETVLAPTGKEIAETGVADTEIAGDEQVRAEESGDDFPEADSSVLASVTMPCPTCEEAVPVLVGACPVCGTDMLAPLRGADAAHQSQFVREIMAMSRAARLSMAAGLAIALLVVIFAVTAVV